MMRVAGNLAWVAGPPIGGLLAMKSYALLFFFDAVTSFVTALIVWFKLPETKPALADETHQESLIDTLLAQGLNYCRTEVQEGQNLISGDTEYIPTDCELLINIS